MKLVTVIILAVFTITAVAQKSPVDKVISKYADKEGIEVQLIEPGSEEFRSEVKLEGDEVNDALAQLESIQIIKCDSKEASASTIEKFYNKTLDALEDERYVELMNVKGDDGEKVSFHVVQPDASSINEMVLLVNEEDGFMMVHVKGNVDMSNLNFGELMSVFSNGPNKKCGHEGEDEHEHDDDEHDHNHSGQ